jgi:hypothetical protein
MGLLFVQVLPRGDGDPGSPAPAVLQCRRCRLDAASMGAILSRDFHGRLGRAYLFDRVYVLLLLPLPDLFILGSSSSVHFPLFLCSFLTE